MLLNYEQVLIDKNGTQKNEKWLLVIHGTIYFHI
jgi:hypothetical protein